MDLDGFGRRFDCGRFGGVGAPRQGLSDNELDDQRFGAAVVGARLPARCRQDVDDDGGAQVQVQVNVKVNGF